MASARMYATRTVSGNQPVMRRLKEKAAQTFKSGVPVMVDPVTGFIIEWDGVSLVGGIAGIAKEPANNLTTSGVAQQATFPGDVPNQSSAQNISRPYFNDGLIEVEIAAADTVFFGEVGSAQTPVQADIQQNYGMTKDADGHWYVDRTKVGAAAVVKIVKLDDNDSRGVQFVVLPAAAQALA